MLEELEKVYKNKDDIVSCKERLKILKKEFDLPPPPYKILGNKTSTTHLSLKINHYFQMFISVSNNYKRK